MSIKTDIVNAYTWTSTFVKNRISDVKDFAVSVKDGQLGTNIKNDLGLTDGIIEDYSKLWASSTNFDYTLKDRNPVDIASEITSNIGTIAQVDNNINKFLDYENLKEINDKSFLDRLNDAIGSIGNLVEIAGTSLDEFFITPVSDFLGIDSESNEVFGNFLTFFKLIYQTAASTLRNNYTDGVSETDFGGLMQESWVGSSNSFLNYFSRTKKVRILDSTPLDSGGEQNAVYGSLMLGAPFLLNDVSDPCNRTIVNSIIKDCSFLSLTPGFPKYNGLTSRNTTVGNNQLKLFRDKSGDEKLSYLTRNGLDKAFSNFDKRYYSFKTDYNQYFSYLETMLNTIWIKLGLGTDGSNFNIFSFFNIKTSDGIQCSNYNELKSQYNSSIGFFTNPSGTISEMIDNSSTSFNLGSKANEYSERFQEINYLTGMGEKQTARKIGIMDETLSMFGELFKGTFSSTANALGSFNVKKPISSIANVAMGVTKDSVRLNYAQDFKSVFQSFSTTNGMKVVYPELWSDSSFSRSLNFNFSFVSPYGDPLSIFKYVYVPFCALACFALPRQADENGYVSPFFIRSNIPGLFTSDLGLITSFTWVKGGSSNLWTKDLLPRAIDCSITISDLYPYLAMTQRLSFLSANPSYTSFLDNFSGMYALAEDDSTNGLNTYFKELINKVNGESTSNRLWNKFSTKRQSENKRVMSSETTDIGKNLTHYDIKWMNKK